MVYRYVVHYTLSDPLPRTIICYTSSYLSSVLTVRSSLPCTINVVDYPCHIFVSLAPVSLKLTALFSNCNPEDAN